MALACLFFSKKAPRPVPLASRSAADAMVMDFEVPEAAAPMPASTEASASVPSYAAEARASRAAVAHRDAKSPASVAEALSQEVSVLETGTPPKVDASVGSEANRFASFLPAHPNLSGRMGLSPPDEKPRDFLAAPTTKNEIASSSQPRLKLIQGSDGVVGKVAEDGSIRFNNPGTIRPNKLPIFAFSDGMDDGKGPPKDPYGIAKNRSPYSAFREGVRVGVSGTLDLTAKVMKLAGQDPYASAKRTVAEETREQRLCMAEHFRGERQKEELLALSDHARHLAARVDLSAAQRRELLFDLWDECSEGGHSTTDYGAMARATILSIVRESFPLGSDRAYQPSELLAFNERRSSRQRFAPYDPIPLTVARQPDGGAPAGCP
jgi:hypothetical protein